MLNWEGTDARATSEVYEKISRITREIFGKIPNDGTGNLSVPNIYTHWGSRPVPFMFYMWEILPFPFRAYLDNEILIPCSLTKP